MTKTLEKEIKLLMWKINPLRLNYSIDRLFKGIGIYDIMKKYKVSEEFLRHFINVGYIAGPDWRPVAYNQNLSELFMIDFQDKLDWMSISIAQNLSESFMRKMKHKILWNHAAENQKMSSDFIIEFHDRINYYCLVKNRHKDMKVLPETLIYELSLLINRAIFKEVFIKKGIITSKRLKEMAQQYNWEDRFDILDM